MDDAIKKEQERLAENLRNSTEEETKKKGFALLCWLKGYEVGYESAKEQKNEKR